MSNFPELDSPRRETDGRIVLSDVGSIEPYVDDRAEWCSMPLRVVCTDSAGRGIEMGPYSLDDKDIRILRLAIAMYDTRA